MSVASSAGGAGSSGIVGGVDCDAGAGASVVVADSPPVPIDGIV